MSRPQKPTVLSRMNEESLRNPVDTISNYAIITLDTDGFITSWNRGAQNIYGWAADDVMTKYFGFIYEAADQECEEPRQNLDRVKSEGFYHEEGLRKKADGSLFLADVSIFTVPEMIAAKRSSDLIMITKDVTQRKKDETDQIDANLLLRQEIGRRKAAQKALKESNNELDAFASAASHDLQEPLRMVVSYLQLIEKRYKDQFDRDGREFLEFAIDGAARMRALINDLVVYSRIETLGKPFKQTDAEKVLSRVLSNLEVSIQESQAQITHDKLPIIWSDEVQLNELFQNLLANAIKFGDKQPIKIHVGAEKKGDEYIFSVADNGKGIDKKYFDTIFLIFKQLGDRALRSGSGVGLAIARKIVARHNGRMWLDSTVGEGTTFYFSIPAELKSKAKKGKAK